MKPSSAKPQAAKLIRTVVHRLGRRPLSAKQLTYALADVTHLRGAYRYLKEELEKNGRHGWLKEEMDILLNPATYEQDRKMLGKG